MVEINWEFDDEEMEFRLPKVGDRIRIRQKIDSWFHKSNRWEKLYFNLPIKIVDIKLVKDIDYLISSYSGKRIPIGKYKLPTDYDGYMFLADGDYYPWIILENFEIIKSHRNL